MKNTVKDINIKNTQLLFCFRYQYNFDPNNIKTDEKSYKNILIYYIAYVTIKYSEYVKINS